ncbi:MAG TPA: hypothetical protein DCF61_06345 [Alphaproteobacteria bacterium]|nr:hypothetical protein [Alphaproteobacteria bacterium]
MTSRLTVDFKDVETLPSGQMFGIDDNRGATKGVFVHRGRKRYCQPRIRVRPNGPADAVFRQDTA